MVSNADIGDAGWLACGEGAAEYVATDGVGEG